MTLGLTTLMNELRYIDQWLSTEGFETNNHLHLGYKYFEETKSKSWVTNERFKRSSFVKYPKK